MKHRYLTTPTSVFEGISVMDDSDNSTDDPKHTLLHTSIKKKDLHMIKHLIEMSVDINTCCPCGVGHFASAVCSGSARIVNILISNKADVNAPAKTERSPQLFSPLHVACVANNCEIARILIESKADVNAVSSSGGCTPMHISSCLIVDSDLNISDHHDFISDNIYIQTLLISKNANINAQNNDGQTPLHVAIRHGTPNMQDFLIHNGADLNICDVHKNNALDYAVYYGSSATTALVLSNGCHVKDHAMPLVCEAARRGCWSILMQLLSNGASVNATDACGNNAIHYAVDAETGIDNCCRETHIIRKLVVRGCNPLHANNVGLTPLSKITSKDPKTRSFHCECILLEYAIAHMYRYVYGSPPSNRKEVVSSVNTSLSMRDVDLLFEIISGTVWINSRTPCEFLNDLRRIHETLLSDSNAKEMLAGEPPTKNAKQRRNERRVHELELRMTKASYLQAVLRRSSTPSFTRGNAKECVVCFALCYTASLPVLAPCGHRSVCGQCLLAIEGLCPECRTPVKCVVCKIYD